MNCDPCKENICNVPNDFLVYNLQNSNAEFPADDPTGDPCAPCIGVTCPVEFTDLTIYNLQSNIVFNTEPITVTVPCPAGWDCGGTVVIVYPPGTFVLPDPEGETFIAQGCLSLISTTSLEQLFAQLAAQQAQCSTTSNPPDDWHPPTFPPPPPTQTWLNQAVSKSVPCSSGELLVYSGTPPYWITVDEAGFVVNGASSVFASTVSQAAANALAQAALDAWVAAALADSSLECQEPFENELQTITCPSGNADYYHSYDSPFDGETGISATDGVISVAAGYYHGATQAAANALAAAAGQVRFDAAVATDQIECCPELTGSVVSESATAPYSISGAFAGYTVTVSYGGSGCTGGTPTSLSSINGDYLITLPDCAKGRTIRATCHLFGHIDCTRSAPFCFQAYLHARESFSGPPAVFAAATQTTVCNVDNWDVDQTGSGTVAVPNTPGAKTINVIAFGAYWGGSMTGTVEIEIL